MIIITTKSGKGLEKGKPQVSFSSNVSFDVVGRLPEFQKTYAQGSGGVFSTTSGTSWGPKISELPNDATYGGNTDNEYTQKFGKQQENIMFPSVQQPVLTRGLLHRRMTMQKTSSTQESPGAIH